MRDALTQLFCKRYPVLFADCRRDATESGMAWGFQHDDGWFTILDVLARVVTAHAPGATAALVKHKMGALRFSLCQDDSFTREACAAAERFSLTISEVSGRRGVLMIGRQGRWLKTLATDEIPGFVPVSFTNPAARAGGPAYNEFHRAPEPNIPQPHAAGARAFHQAMANRLHPISAAHSDDCSHRFRLKPATDSDRSQPGIPMIPAG